MSRPRLMQRVLRFFAERRLLPEARMLEWYPPFLAMRIKVIQLDRDWREVRIRLPLNAISRDRKSTRLNSSHRSLSRMPSSA